MCIGSRVKAEVERRCVEEELNQAKDKQWNQEKAESRAQLEEKKTRYTTLKEYIYSYYTLLSKPLHVQTDQSLSTQGSITSPKNKLCPTLLKPWIDFPILQ